jgi:hypothetical protein
MHPVTKFIPVLISQGMGAAPLYQQYCILIAHYAVVVPRPLPRIRRLNTTRAVRLHVRNGSISHPQLWRVMSQFWPVSIVAQIANVFSRLGNRVVVLATAYIQCSGKPRLGVAAARGG